MNTSADSETNEVILLERPLSQRLSRSLDFTRPHWFYPAKGIRRITYHFGPPNSGKTHDARDQFEKAAKGIYCAPLRLLARENFLKSQKKGIECDLVTGEEIVICRPDGQPASHVCCTVFCANINETYDVAVIDEIQMIADEQAGWAYTRALLGLQAKHLILCGDATALELVSRLVKPFRESVRKWEHKRPTSLETTPSCKSKIENIQDSDCVVCFSRGDIAYLSRELRKMGKPTAHIYGILPPSVKIRQSQLFNNYNNNTNILLATDAIGMGLNLVISRIVFYDIYRNKKILSAAKLQQIAGRAGRMYTKFDKGYVTTFHENHFEKMKQIVNEEPAAVTAAGILPTDHQMNEFCLALSKENKPNIKTLVDYMTAFGQNVLLDKEKYFLCDMNEMIEKAKVLEDVRMKFHEKYRMCQAPINIDSESATPESHLFKRAAQCLSEEHILHLDEFLQLIEWDADLKVRSVIELRRLEFWATACSFYNWLAIEFQSTFPDKHLLDPIDISIIDQLHVAIDNLGYLSDFKNQPPPSHKRPRPSNSRIGPKERSKPLEILYI